MSYYHSLTHPPPAHLLLQDDLVLLGELFSLHGEAVPLILQLLVQPQLVLIHLGLQLVLQTHQLLLVLPPHPLVPVRRDGALSWARRNVDDYHGSVALLTLNIRPRLGPCYRKKKKNDFL